jgi:hypothetical protein
MKIKEKSTFVQRCLVPAGCREYETQYIAENTRRLVFTMGRPPKGTILWFKRPEARVYWATDIKSKNIKGLKSVPYKQYEG